ncbi:hypothetical protein NQ314_019372 [Rhamnusium bicolor]|uniref:Uncharacterized protein n=1 Tax=Rhamnusium bicolor TaxID=1586634 RepID=A0AAV8WPK4_9CUCU|nr:hypothetical protein NQ314_019372 [Rhamnusium bicolor]
MVRKRSRKHYDSDENDSDSDFSLDDPPYEPGPKKYSLRQRKRPLFTEDFDYDEDGEEVVPPKASSDDEDFEVEKELELNEAPDTEYVDKTAYMNHYEPDAEDDDMPEDADGLIDFEDMIRADIVVNKNRIDYDNIIQKTEIKVQPIEEVQQPVKSKRGRKPKIRPAGEIDSSILEPETEVQEAEDEDKNDKDYNPEDDALDEEPSEEPILDCEKTDEKAELKESQEENIIETDQLPNNDETTLNSTKLHESETDKNPQEDEVNKSDDISGENNISQDVSPESLQESVIKVNDNFSKDLTQVNGNASSNDLKKSDEKLPEITKQEITEIDDDDVVLVEDEKKCEVIVLDD